MFIIVYILHPHLIHIIRSLVVEILYTLYPAKLNNNSSSPYISIWEQHLLPLKYLPSGHCEKLGVLYLRLFYDTRVTYAMRFINKFCPGMSVAGPVTAATPFRLMSL